MAVEAGRRLVPRLEKCAMLCIWGPAAVTLRIPPRLLLLRAISDLIEPLAVQSDRACGCSLFQRAQSARLIPAERIVLYSAFACVRDLEKIKIRSFE